MASADGKLLGENRRRIDSGPAEIAEHLRGVHASRRLGQPDPHLLLCPPI